MTVEIINYPKASDAISDNDSSVTADAGLSGMMVSNVYPGGFEGPEKLLEIWFSPSPNKVPKSRAASQYNTDDDDLEDPQTSINESSDGSDVELTSKRFMEEVRRVTAASSSSSSSSSRRQWGRNRNYRRGLRTVPRAVWDEMLAIVKCEVVNVVKNEFVDAFLLSESSMFVFPHKLILKTCGTTTLLHALQRILSIAQELCGFNKVWRVFYSRKCFLFPERQLGPHKSWKSEVNFLDRHFEHGSAYKIGRVNGDHWYLYLTRPADNVLNHEWEMDEEDGFVDLEAEISDMLVGKPGPDAVSFDDGSSASSLCSSMIRSFDSYLISPPSLDADLDQAPSFFARSGYPRQDQTIEILMHKLDPVAMRAFYQRPGEKAATAGGRRVDKETGLCRLYPGAILDSYLFSPCGYSANALLEGGYFTIHVTPEEACSYASFETNIPVQMSHGFPASKKTAIQNLIEQVTAIFQPAEFCVSYFASLPERPRTASMSDSAYFDEDDDEEEEARHRERARLQRSMGRVEGYRRSDRILYEFEGYDLVFGHYLRA